MTSSSKSLALSALLLVGACGKVIDDSSLKRPIDVPTDRPGRGEPIAAAPYTGSDPIVKEAQMTLANGNELLAKVISRTCTPNQGVCHNAKEYPDLRTAEMLLKTVNAPCNVQPGTPELVFNRCERTGDRFKLSDKSAGVEVGWVDYIQGEWKNDAPKDAKTPGLHVYLSEPATTDDKATIDATGRFYRNFVDGTVVENQVASHYARWYVLDNGKHLLAQVPQDRIDTVQRLLATPIIQGDQNRDGTFGARMGPPVPMIKAGAPEESYLIARLRGMMRRGMVDEVVPGSRMPLANQPLSVPEMLAFFCFVEGLAKQPEPLHIASDIDYVNCSYAKNPGDLNLLGAGVTWKRRVKLILDATCAGCHSGDKPQGDLNLQDDKVYARLLQASVQKPAIPLVTPKDPMKSYLWLKLIGDPSIAGQRMPSSQNNDVKLAEAELADIKAWIEAGAQEDQ